MSPEKPALWQHHSQVTPQPVASFALRSYVLRGKPLKSLRFTHNARYRKLGNVVKSCYAGIVTPAARQQSKFRASARFSVCAPHGQRFFRERGRPPEGPDLSAESKLPISVGVSSASQRGHLAGIGTRAVVLGAIAHIAPVRPGQWWQSGRLP